MPDRVSWLFRQGDQMAEAMDTDILQDTQNIGLCFGITYSI